MIRDTSILKGIEMLKKDKGQYKFYNILPLLGLSFGTLIIIFVFSIMDGMEKVIKKNIDTFESAMLSYAKKRSTDLSWDEQVVNNIKVKTAHFFKLPIPIAQTDDDIEMSEKQQELIEFTESKGWSTKMWDAAIELEAYTREVAKKELGK